MTIKTISASTLRKWLEDEKVILIDVREPSEHARQNIARAHLIPLASITTEKLATDWIGKKIVIHCQAGVRSKQACQKLDNENPKLDLYTLEGGINAWNDLSSN